MSSILQDRVQSWRIEFNPPWNYELRTKIATKVLWQSWFLVPGRIEFQSWGIEFNPGGVEFNPGGVEFNPGRLNLVLSVAVTVTKVTVVVVVVMVVVVVVVVAVVVVSVVVVVVVVVVVLLLLLLLLLKIIIVLVIVQLFMTTAETAACLCGSAVLIAKELFEALLSCDASGTK